ncbi:MAG: tRNA (adenosine(37)-N6)-threonylcarbamoyltransferase complex ATPase subunit type 1 TsaE [Vampirovibrionia bacterium]
MIKTFTLNEIENVANYLFKKINNTKHEGAKLITLSGDLGTGKTTFTKELAKILGVEKEIISPTFVIMKKYKTKNKNFKYLIHIDAYRLKNGKDLLNLGWQEIVSDKDNLIIMEWPEMVEDCLNNERHKVILGHKDANTRSIEILL